MHKENVMAWNLYLLISGFLGKPMHRKPQLDLAQNSLLLALEWAREKGNLGDLPAGEIEILRLFIALVTSEICRSNEHNNAWCVKPPWYIALLYLKKKCYLYEICNVGVRSKSKKFPHRKSGKNNFRWGFVCFKHSQSMNNDGKGKSW